MPIKPTHRVPLKKKVQEVLINFPDGLSAAAVTMEINKTYSVTQTTIASVLSQMLKYNAVIAVGSRRCEHCGAKTYIYKKGRVNAYPSDY